MKRLIINECINALICPWNTGETASGEASKIRSNGVQSGFSVHPHLHSDAEEPRG